jgi:hypothetical protein
LWWSRRIRIDTNDQAPVVDIAGTAVCGSTTGRKRLLDESPEHSVRTRTSNQTVMSE